MTGIFLEVGPAAVTRLVPRPQPLVDQELVATALTGIDDSVVLYRERPVAVADLWRSVIASSVGKRCESVTLVHPSWWAEHRVAKVVGAAATVATEVHARPRSTVLAAGEAATVVEIADDLVAVVTDECSPLVRRRTDDPMDVAEMIEKDSGTAVLIDAPPTVSGSAEYARLLRTALRRDGVDVRVVGIRAPVPSAPEPPVATRPASRRRRGPVLVATGMALTLCTIGATATRTWNPTPTSDAVLIVEGRIAVRIPSDWVVTRITAGPGSRRIQASSPTESDVVLHITQSYAPGQTLEQAAEVLSRAVHLQSGGVFVDFNSADRRGGRSAVTYRELRIARQIRWTVIIDGATRISIGCQGEKGGPETVTQPCEQAIESARELGGTKSGP
ncbi:type VII secretion-associated protein [Mycolicibacterium sp. P1-5]|uniref:type VII secretion-associated protein n=1 Tax=Mycolicibacterium sp. P1-5 TaxID=2024617 RepID=UPI0011EF497A|nr:type VII secretion-associated protein [Mycolicibacterium sp. P1-5]